MSHAVVDVGVLVVAAGGRFLLDEGTADCLTRTECDVGVGPRVFLATERLDPLEVDDIKGNMRLLEGGADLKIKKSVYIIGFKVVPVRKSPRIMANSSGPCEGRYCLIGPTKHHYHVYARAGLLILQPFVNFVACPINRIKLQPIRCNSTSIDCKKILYIPVFS